MTDETIYNSEELSVVPLAFSLKQLEMIRDQLLQLQRFYTFQAQLSINLLNNLSAVPNE
jgi:hypothetical protein